MAWKTDVIRYNVYLSLGSGGSRIGSYKTLQEAREAVKNAHRDDLLILKTYYQKMSNGKYRIILQDRI